MSFTRLILIALLPLMCHVFSLFFPFVSFQVDHFSFTNNETFQIRYLINDTYWKRNGGPIFFYTGNEGDIDLFSNNTVGISKKIQKTHFFFSGLHFLRKCDWGEMYIAWPKTHFEYFGFLGFCLSCQHWSRLLFYKTSLLWILIVLLYTHPRLSNEKFYKRFFFRRGDIGKPSYLYCSILNYTFTTSAKFSSLARFQDRWSNPNPFDIIFGQ